MSNTVDQSAPAIIQQAGPYGVNHSAPAIVQEAEGDAEQPPETARRNVFIMQLL